MNTMTMFAVRRNFQAVGLVPVRGRASADVLAGRVRDLVLKGKMPEAVSGAEFANGSYTLGHIVRQNPVARLALMHRYLVQSAEEHVIGVGERWFSHAAFTVTPAMASADGIKTYLEDLMPAFEPYESSEFAAPELWSRSAAVLRMVEGQHGACTAAGKKDLRNIGFASVAPQMLDKILWDSKGRLEGADISESSFSYMYLSNAKFFNVTATRAAFYDATLRGVVFDDCGLREAKFMGSHLPGTKFRKTDLTGADFRDVRLDRVRFADLKHVYAAEVDGQSVIKIDPGYAGMRFRPPERVEFIRKLVLQANAHSQRQRWHEAAAIMRTLGGMTWQERMAVHWELSQRLYTY